MEFLKSESFWQNVGIFATVIVIFLAIREILNWYWKINQRVALLEEMRDQNEKIINRLEAMQYRPPDEDGPRLVANRD